MRHKRNYRKLGLPTQPRMALLRSLLLALVTYNRIETTETRAKEIRGLAEKLVTLAKRGDLHSIRQAHKILPNKTALKKLKDDVAPKFKEKQSGYTRMFKKGVRRGDAAPIVILEFH